MYAFMKYDAGLSLWRVFLPDAPETTFEDETLRNLLDAFTVHDQWHDTGGEHIERTYLHEAS